MIYCIDFVGEEGVVVVVLGWLIGLEWGMFGGGIVVVGVVVYFVFIKLFV